MKFDKNSGSKCRNIIVILAIAISVLSIASGAFSYFTDYVKKQYSVNAGIAVALGQNSEGIIESKQENYRRGTNEKGWYRKGDHTLLSAMTAEGYEFDGWYSGEEKIVEKAAGEYLVQEPVTVYAKAKPIPYMMSGPKFQQKIAVNIKNAIKEIEFVDTIPEDKKTEDVNQNIWDVSHLQNNSVIAWLDETGTKMYIGGEGYVYGNVDESVLFAGILPGDSREEAFSNLESIKIGDVFDSHYAENMSYMFCGTKVSELEADKLDVAKVKNMDSMFRECTELVSLDVGEWNTSNVESMNSMFRGRNKNYPMNIAMLDVSKWDMSNVKTTADMFAHCQKITTLDVSAWDTSSLEATNHMFNGCINLAELDVSKWDVSKVKDMRCMFQLENTGNKGRPPITTLDVSAWDTSSCENMYYMFFGCGHVKELDVSNWDVSKVKNFQRIFCDMYELESIDTTQWNTSSAENMSGMFNDCQSLVTLDVSGLDTENVTNFSAMFSGNHALTQIIGLNKLNTSKATTLHEMFDYCDALVEVDVSSFDTSNVSDMSKCFSHMGGENVLTKIITGEKFSFTGNGTSSSYPGGTWYNSMGERFEKGMPDNVADVYTRTKPDNTTP